MDIPGLIKTSHAPFVEHVENVVNWSFCKSLQELHNSALHECRRPQTNHSKPNGPRQGQKPQLCQVRQETITAFQQRR